MTTASYGCPRRSRGRDPERQRRVTGGKIDARRSTLLPLAILLVGVAALVATRLGDDTAGERATRSSPDGTETDGGNAASTGRVRFKDVTSDAGLDEPHSDTDLTGESAMTAGVAVADIDSDGDLDMFLTRVGRADRLMLNDGSGRFDDRTAEAGLDIEETDGSSAANFVDVDADGDLDLVTTGAGPKTVTLHRNDGDGKFADATAGSGLDTPTPLAEGGLAQAHGLATSDYDHDGLLDLVVTHWDSALVAALSDPAANSIQPDENDSIVCARSKWLAERGWPRDGAATANRSRVYHNEGNGRFRDVTAETGIPFAEIMAFTARFVDVDGDRWDDLFITGDFCTSRVFRNVEGTRFDDITASFRPTDENGMGSVITDVNADRVPDWFVTSIGPVGDEPAPLQLGGFGNSGNRLYVSEPDGTWTDHTDEFGVRNGGWGWGAAHQDFGNDGHWSFVMTNGYSVGDDDARPPDPLVMWRPHQPGSDTERPLTDIAARVGLTDEKLGRALVPFDMDRDGDLDIVIANFGDSPVLYRNDSPERRWLTVQLDDPTSAGNRRGVGAVVTVIRVDGQPITRWLDGGGSYESQEPTEIHFGLGDGDDVERVEVLWPGSNDPQIVENPAVDDILVVTRR